MKNSRLLTVYLNECAEDMRLGAISTVEAQEQLLTRLADQMTMRAWQACRDDGWTKDELDATYRRRFPDLNC